MRRRITIRAIEADGEARALARIERRGAIYRGAETRTPLFEVDARLDVVRSLETSQ